ncbi:cystathionine beta-lyase [Devosia yakushimensis]|uniref:Cystathionine beta-lyase n=1 Tax=Devosia yakushimensis TaxID=470028 RepID=A0ABQ5ULN9_9HYPH|nr:cystathionine beta-lyase [Devosia yakushimensis]GLQ12108.1 cystathionine beta-lyase [Devosia yakushimensis]
MHWKTKLIQSDVRPPEGFKSLVTPIQRASTVVFSKQSDVSSNWRHAQEGYTYGLYGTPTSRELAARIGELEGAYRTIVLPGGQAAISLIYLAFCSAGDHALVPYSAYGPNKELAENLLGRLGIEVEPYDPLIGAGIASLIRDNTKLIWCESPGSVTMEIQDVRGISEAAHDRGVLVALDNTYAAGVLFDAFSHGVDLSMQALTKYVGGHSDLMLATISVANDAVWERIGTVHRLVGMAVSPDECALALRGLQTLAVRMDRLQASTLTVASWLREHPAVETVLHPAFPDCPGHEYWLRDFSGSSSVFSVKFRDAVDPRAVENFVDTLKLFSIGFSWGGVHSLVILYPRLVRPGKDYGGRLVRFNIGLEEPADLIGDLQDAMQKAGIS